AGSSAARARVNEALHILDSMHIAARRPARINPNDAIPVHDAATGIDFVHPFQWRFYRQALTQAIAARDQIALGTFRLHQPAPDANCTPATALRARSSGGGFMFLYETEGLNRTELARVPPRAPIAPRRAACAAGRLAAASPARRAAARARRPRAAPAPPPAAAPRRAGPPP